MTQIHPEKSPDESIRAQDFGHVNVNRIEISERALSIIALCIAVLALGAYFALPAVIDAKVQAGMAKSEAQSNEARINARIALDKVEDFRTKLSEKGIHVNLDGH